MGFIPKRNYPDELVGDEDVTGVYDILNDTEQGSAALRPDIRRDRRVLPALDHALVVGSEARLRLPTHYENMLRNTQPMML